MGDWKFVIDSFVAGLLASLACGLGALPPAYPGKWIETRSGLGYAFAGGLMMATSFYNLLMPALVLGGDSVNRLAVIFQILLGLYLGCAMLWVFQQWLTAGRSRQSHDRVLQTAHASHAWLCCWCNDLFSRSGIDSRCPRNAIRLTDGLDVYAWLWSDGIHFKLPKTNDESYEL